MPEQGPSDEITRRRFVRDAGIATVAVSELIRGPALSATPRRHRKRRETVAVFGAGIAGLTAAHELAERGFDVTLYESRAWGGKARSTTIPNTATGGRKPLPGEHGFRFEFGFYQNIPDTMRRIPFESNPNGVFDNLVASPQVAFARTTKRDIYTPIGQLEPRAYTPQQVLDLVVGVLVERQIPPEAAAYFAQRLAVFFSSCDARRQDDWQNTPWTDFIGTDRYPDDYYKTLGAASQFTQASKPEATSTTWMGLAFEWTVYGLLGFGVNGPNFRVLNGPTNDTWIDPWVGVLRKLKVRLRPGYRLTGFETRRGRIIGARVRTARGRRIARADWYVCALPVEYACRMWNPAILRADPRLASMRKLPTAWINGVQFFLRTRPQIINGLLICADSPWAVTVVPQAQYWRGDFASTYGDGQVHEKLSTAIADWTSPGVVYGKPARDLTPRQVVHDLWEQIKLHVNEPGQPPELTDEMVLRTDIDDGMVLRNGRLISRDPLVLPTAGTAQYRPDVATRIPNLLLCGDYLRGQWEIAIMEAASYSGRRAANEILERTHSREDAAAMIPPYRPPEWEPFKRIDEDRYRRGQPNLFDSDLGQSQVSELLRRFTGS